MDGLQAPGFLPQCKLGYQQSTLLKASNFPYKVTVMHENTPEGVKAIVMEIKFYERILQAQSLEFQDLHGFIDEQALAMFGHL